MKTTKRKLRLSTETVRLLSLDELKHVDGGNVVRPTQGNSCNGNSCDFSCAGVC